MAMINIRREQGKKLIDSSMRASSLFPAQAYDEDSHLFAMDDGTSGFVVMCEPIPGVSNNNRQAVEAFFQNTPFPEGTLLQINMFRSPDLKAQLGHIYALRENNNNPVFEAIIQDRINFLDKATVEPLVKRFGQSRYIQGMLFDLKIIVSVKVPIEGAVPTEDEQRALQNLQSDVTAGLTAAGMRPNLMDANDYIRVMNTMLNWGPNASWRAGATEYDEEMPISEQLMDYDTDLQVNKDELLLGDYHVRTLSAKRMPKHAYFGMAMATYVGDVMQGNANVSEYYMVSMNLYYPPAVKEKSKFERNRGFVVSQSQGKMMQYIPVLAEKRQDFDALNKDAVDEGFRFVKISLTTSIFTPDRARAVESAARLRAYWRNEQFEMVPNKLTHHVNFFNSLPLMCDPTALTEMWRFKTMTTRQAATLAPVFGEWKGTGTPYVSLISRNGQLMSFNKFDSQTNFNTVIAATSGSGKSFSANNEMDSHMSDNARVFVIDVGRSYEKLVENYGGDFIEFSDDSQVCINPFPLIQDYREEADFLCSIIALMISSTRELEPFQRAELKRVLSELYEVHGKDMTVDTIHDRLVLDKEKRLVDMGKQLFSFTSKGDYGRFFNGPNNISFTKQMTVLELEELKNKPDLQVVVLAQMLYQIQQAIYLDTEGRSRKKLLYIDEAWSLLNSPNVGDAINSAYRRFRKYGASISLISQGLSDFSDGPAGKAILSNSAMLQLLGQTDENIDLAIRNGDLILNDYDQKLLGTVHTRPGMYSEVFIKSDSGIGIGRLFVTDAQVLMYSTHHADVSAIQRYRNQGLNQSEAIQAVLRDRGQLESVD